MVKTVSVFAAALSLLSCNAFADVYPFEEEYDGAVATKTTVTTTVQAEKEAPVAPQNEFSVRQTTVTAEDREEARQLIEEENRRDTYLVNREITWKNFGSIAINLVNGIGLVYHDLFTRALPEYGGDLASIPGGTVALTGKFVELERQAIFERDAKRKDIEAYIEAQQKPLTPEEQKLLKDLRGKPISGR